MRVELIYTYAERTLRSVGGVVLLTDVSMTEALQAYLGMTITVR